MERRHDATIVAALQAMAQAMQNNNNQNVVSMEKFQKNNLPTFEGRYNPDGAQSWLRVIEKIFRVMNCANAQKVQYGTHMLSEEAKDWWDNSRRRLEAAGT